MGFCLVWFWLVCVCGFSFGFGFFDRDFKFWLAWDLGSGGESLFSRLLRLYKYLLAVLLKFVPGI